MSRQVKIILGPPGTGKTTRLLSIVQDALDRGIEPERIAYCSFTKKAAEEVSNRMAAAFSIDIDRFRYFRTLHSLAYRVLGLLPNQVMRKANYTELGEILGLEFTGKYNPEMVCAAMPFFGKLGDKCMTIYALSRAMKVSIEEAWHHYTGRSAPDLGYVKDFAEKLNRYKYKHDLYDFTDFLDTCKTALDIDIFILDEAQDLTRQQWDFAKAIAKNAKEVWIAGDDDQTIFQWAGADLRTFLSIQGEREVLPLSYRLPNEIQGFCENIIQQVDYRYPKVWRGQDKPGGVEWVTAIENLDLLNGQSWMLLGRHNHQLLDYIKLCTDKGVVYKIQDGEWSNQHPKVKAVISWERLRKGKEITRSEYKDICKYTVKIEDAPERSMYRKENFKNVDFEEDWITALELMPPEEREYVRRLRFNKESLVNTGRVEISTIHGSKGGEAENVVLLHDLTERSYRSLLTDKDNEHRVFYVGASRAKTNLFITCPLTTRSYFRC